MRQKGEIVSNNNNEQAIRATLDRLVGLVDESRMGITMPSQLREQACGRALEVFRACQALPGADILATVGFAAEMIGAISVDLAARPEDAGRLFTQIEHLLGVPRVVLERHKVPVGEQPNGPSAITTAEGRRLARLRFDLHDGPQQDVHLLASDLELFRRQLLSTIATNPHADRVVGRLDDLAAQLVALDGNLRRLSSSLQSPFLHPGSLADALSEITGAFAARTGIEPHTRLTGDLNNLTDSQQITLLALIREALSNVRQHSGARTIEVTIFSQAGRIEARVVDDGCGFETETTLVRAAREGHLGLVGMRERVRMLGGLAQIDSKPGGPTVVSAILPPWPAAA